MSQQLVDQSGPLDARTAGLLPHVLSTGHELRLRCLDDVPDFYRLTMMAKHRLRRFESWPADYRFLVDEYRYAQRLLAACRLGAKLPLGFYDEGLPVGCLVGHLDLVDHSATVSYWLAGHATGRGAATAGVTWLCEHLFAHRGVRRIEIHTVADNVHSQAVANRCGFTACDRFLEPVLIAGELRERVSFELTRAT